MRSGRLTKRFRLERKTAPVGDFTGAGAPAWNPLGPVVAGALEPLGGDEKLVAQQMESHATHKLTLHYSETTAQLRSADRAVRQPGGGAYEVTSVANVEGRNHWVECEVIERV